MKTKTLSTLLAILIFLGIFALAFLFGCRTVIVNCNCPKKDTVYIQKPKFYFDNTPRPFTMPSETIPYYRGFKNVPIYITDSVRNNFFYPRNLKPL